jgi:hypothetical protein
MAKKRYTPPRDIPAETRAFAENLAEKLGGEPEQYRYAEYRQHDGRRWTVTARWEQCVDGEWTPIEDNVLGVVEY